MKKTTITMNALFKFSTTWWGRAILSFLIYVAVSIAVIQLFYSAANLLSPSDRAFKLLPLEFLFDAHYLFFRNPFSMATKDIHLVLYISWVVYWCSVIYLMIFAAQRGLKVWYTSKWFISALTVALSLLASASFGNKGQEYWNLIYGVTVVNLIHLPFMLFIPVKAVFGRQTTKTEGLR